MERTDHRPTVVSSGLDTLDLATLKTMLDASVDSILVIDERGSIQAYNQAVLRDFGFDGHELLGANVSMLMPMPHRLDHDQYLQNYLRTGERKIIGIGRDVTGKRKDGSFFPLHLSVGEFLDKGQRFFFGICHDITERKELHEQIMRMATYDGLTNCLTRQQLVARLGEYVHQGKRLAVLFIDLNGFKAINDNYGHPTGDKLLAQVAQRLRNSLRKGDLLGRVGGDEFVACLMLDANASDPAAQARRLATRLVSGLTTPFEIGDTSANIGASIGISLHPESGSNADELINQADLAMYHIKAMHHDPEQSADSGEREIGQQNHIHLYDQRLHERSTQRHEMLVRLRDAIRKGALQLHYQLQFDMRTLQPCGVEAVLRWHDREYGLVMPDTLIPVARKHGLMLSISAWVLQRACSDNAWLIRQGLLDVPMAVNVSAQSINDRSFIPLVHQCLADAGLPPNRLEMEITEDVAMDITPQALRNANHLVDIGINLVMDDYGVGFSSLKNLKNLRFSKLKIDRSFIMALPESANDKTIVRTTLNLGHGLDIPMVAEGVETREQLDFLRENGCEMGQGFWYARPMPLHRLAYWLRAARSEDSPIPKL